MDAYASVIDMCQLTSKLYKEFHESNKIKKDKVQLEKLKVQIELAKTLGDQDRLRHLALELQRLYEQYQQVGYLNVIDTF
jgi:Tfp pilus assembly protein PilF